MTPKGSKILFQQKSGWTAYNLRLEVSTLKNMYEAWEEWFDET